jgi:hypothetical protein
MWAGLYTRCVRLGNLDADRTDIDLPEPAALLPATPNRVFGGESAPDGGWRDRVATIGGPCLFALGS